MCRLFDNVRNKTHKVRLLIRKMILFAKLTDTAKETGPYRSILTTFVYSVRFKQRFLQIAALAAGLFSVLGLFSLSGLLYDVGVALDEVDGLVDCQILL